MPSGDKYQIALIGLGIAATVFFGIFFARELFPEYRIYQNDYIALEQFRSSYTGEPPPAFKVGVKQIVLEAPNNGPPVIDRCTSCHVALQFEHFSPTKIAHDLNGQIIRDENGFPVKTANENYVWARLDAKIQELSDPAVIKKLQEEGQRSKANAQLEEADRLSQLKVAYVGDKVYDVTKVLQAHPLMGRETRPFEFHSIDEYGCTSCHNGNGRGLTTEKAHGPVFDGQYHIEFEGPKPQFVELDEANDPKFAHVFNSKPGHELLFQTTPLFVGALIQAKCIQCHQSSQEALQGAANTAGIVAAERERRSKAIAAAYQNERRALVSAADLLSKIQNKGILSVYQSLNERAADYKLTQQQMEYALAQLAYLQRLAGTSTIDSKNANDIQKKVTIGLQNVLVEALGSQQLVQKLEEVLAQAKSDPTAALDNFIQTNASNPQAKGTFFAKAEKAALDAALMQHVMDASTSFEQTVSDVQTTQALTTDVDLLTRNFNKGRQLFLSQGCYACHRIAGFTRGGVGPELTREGESYPWFVKESIIWPQADLKTSTMPNYKMDHEEVEDLVTFLLAQKGNTKSVSEAVYKISIAEWEAGRKLPWEKPVTPAQMRDVRFGMTVFATQGCAACHRLLGFESNVGFSAKKEKADTDALYQEKEWFRELFPETIFGSDLVYALTQNAPEIDKRIVDGVRQDSLLEEIEAQHPGLLESYYTPFKYAARAKNKEFSDRLALESDPSKRLQIKAEQDAWKERLHRVLMVFIQEYGLGRLVGPRPNWSGVYRSDEWLMEHFRAPTSHVPRSIMPVFPFDDTKFYALTYMLDTLGVRNRDSLRKVWQNHGFNAPAVYQALCSQCHGEHLQGNGPVAEWIYPIPKNLRNAQFLRNLTKEQAIQSITHGVKGTPMPPWGETPKDKITYDGKPVLTDKEIRQLVDWMFSGLSGETMFKTEESTPKWYYTPEDVLKDLKQEGHELQQEKAKPHPLLSRVLAVPQHYLASVNPIPTPPAGADANEIFDVVPNPVPGSSGNFYYIKKKYYTPDNIAAGEAFFQLNCAICHGKDADGTGNRAGVMQDAKPRILTNLDWLQTRDDLRLLRSIKYGVLGTSMTPWGDLTSTLQRLQLVMYIRSLSQEKVMRERLQEALYQTFDRMLLVVMDVRSENYKVVDGEQLAYDQAIKTQKATATQVDQGVLKQEEALKSYQDVLKAGKDLKEKKATDALLGKLLDLIKAERDDYQSMGLALIQQSDTSDELAPLIEAIELNKERYSVQEGEILIHSGKDLQKQLSDIKDRMVAVIDAELKRLKEQETIEKGKILSSEVQERLLALKVSNANLTKLRNKLISGFEEATRLREQQVELLNAYNKTLPNQTNQKQQK